MKSNFLNFVFVVLTSIVFAQNATLSPYSYYGFGQPIQSRTAENNAMGGVTSYADSTQFSLENPATLGKLEFIQYRIGARYSTAQLQSSETLANTSAASLNYLALSVPTNKFAFSFGLKPRSSVGYRISASETVDGLEQQSFYDGKGGVSSTFLAVAVNPFEGLSLGAVANYNFGFTEKSLTQGITGIQLNTELATRSELSGIHYTFGMHYNKILFSSYELHLTATYTPSTTLESINTRTISTITSQGVFGTQQDINLGELATTSNKLPSETSLGFGLGKPQQWYAGASFTNTNGGLTNPLETSAEVAFVSSSRVSVGGFYIPKYNSFTRYLERVVYRIGARWENTGIELKNQPIEDFGITFGIGLPMGLLSKINIGVEIGQLGTLDAGLIKENYTNINLGFSLSDVWFIKRKYD